jgi:hypothetical protein
MPSFDSVNTTVVGTSSLGLAGLLVVNDVDGPPASRSGFGAPRASSYHYAVTATSRVLGQFGC